MQKDPNYAIASAQVFILALLAMSVSLFSFFYAESFIHVLHGILLVHISILFCFTLLLFYQYKKNYDLKAIFLLITISAVTGPFGMALCLITMATHHANMKHSRPFNEWVSMFFPEEEVNEDDQLYERLSFGLEDLGDKSNIIPFADIIALGSDDQKRIVLSKLTKHFKPEFASTLLMAINNSSSPIRVQAATSITRLEENFANSIMSLENKLRKLKGPHKFEVLAELAHKCYDYAYSGLIDSKQAHSIRIKAQKYYTALTKDHSISEDNQYRLARIHIDEDHIKDALNIASKSLKSKKQKPEMLSLYMECLYKMQQYSKLRQFSKEHLSKINKNNSNSYFIYETMKLWSEGINSKKINEI